LIEAEAFVQDTGSDAGALRRSGTAPAVSEATGGASRCRPPTGRGHARSESQRQAGAQLS